MRSWKMIRAKVVEVKRYKLKYDPDLEKEVEE